jgi:hypothetical protein
VAGRPLRPATRHCHGGPLPRHLADRPRAHQEAHCCFGFSSNRRMATCGINSPFGELSPTSRQIAHVLRTRSPLDLICITTNQVPFDLHVLSTPPAFVLSQNQTLRGKLLPPAKGGKFRHSMHRHAMIVRKQRVRNGRQISISKPTKERTIQHLLNVFVLKNVLNFAKPAKPESGCQKTTLSEGQLGRFGDDEADRIGRVIGGNQRGQRPRELSPAPTVMSCGTVRIPNLESSSTEF